MQYTTHTNTHTVADSCYLSPITTHALAHKFPCGMFIRCRSLATIFFFMCVHEHDISEQVSPPHALLSALWIGPGHTRTNLRNSWIELPSLPLITISEPLDLLNPIESSAVWLNWGDQSWQPHFSQSLDLPDSDGTPALMWWNSRFNRRLYDRNQCGKLWTHSNTRRKDDSVGH